MDGQQDPIQVRAQALAERMRQYVEEAEAIHGEIDKDDADIWDLFAHKAALELWGQERMKRFFETYLLGNT